MKKVLLVLLAIFVLITPLVAQGAKEGPKYQTLKMYTALDTEEAQYYIEAF